LGSTEAPTIVLLHAASLSSRSYDHSLVSFRLLTGCWLLTSVGTEKLIGQVTITGIGGLKMSNGSVTLSPWTPLTW